MDIIVTTPYSFREQVAQEATMMIKNGGGFYFRRLSTQPKNLNIGDRVWYVEDEYLRGFAIVSYIEYRDTSLTCSTTGKVHENGFFLYMDATTWKWIHPIPYKGFQGWRYFLIEESENGTLFFKSIIKLDIVGGWLDPMPKTPLEKNQESKRLHQEASNSVSEEDIALQFNILKSEAIVDESEGVVLGKAKERAIQKAVERLDPHRICFNTFTFYKDKKGHINQVTGYSFTQDEYTLYVPLCDETKDMPKIDLKEGHYLKYDRTLAHIELSPAVENIDFEF